LENFENEIYQGLIKQGWDPEEAKEVFGSFFNIVMDIPVKDLSVAKDTDGYNKSADMFGILDNVPPQFKKGLGWFLYQCDQMLQQTKPFKPTVPAATDKSSLVLLLSDWHFGRKVEAESKVTYDREIRRARVKKIIQQVIQFKEEHKQEIDELVICVLGDMADGSEIFPGQGYMQEETSLKQGESAAAMLWRLVVSLRPYFENVRMHCVPGNHGRASKTSPADQNWDYLVYVQLYYMAKGHNDPNIQVEYRHDKWINTVVKGKNLHLRHKAPAQAETAACFKKFSGFHDQHKFDIMCYGHLHHPALSWHQNRPLIMCGSLVGPDDLSEEMAVTCRPMQIMFTVPSDPDKPIGQSIPIYLD
jgi:predicted phosphodiesterase